MEPVVVPAPPVVPPVIPDVGAKEVKETSQDIAADIKIPENVPNAGEEQKTS